MPSWTYSSSVHSSVGEVFSMLMSENDRFLGLKKNTRWNHPTVGEGSIVAIITWIKATSIACLCIPGGAQSMTWNGRSVKRGVTNAKRNKLSEHRNKATPSSNKHRQIPPPPCMSSREKERSNTNYIPPPSLQYRWRLMTVPRSSDRFLVEGVNG